MESEKVRGNISKIMFKPHFRLMTIFENYKKNHFIKTRHGREGSMKQTNSQVSKNQLNLSNRYLNDEENITIDESLPPILQTINQYYCSYTYHYICYFLFTIYYYTIPTIL